MTDYEKNMERDGMRTLTKKRTTNFREDETKLLIQLWGSTQVQNKLYLTHRKAPVMRLLAANMQQRGFYRTPDEIKTRIRNLKCLYHRIKRTVTTGAGVGTVDPDWPHFKAMDEILSKHSNKHELYQDNVLEGPRCEDIKTEIDDIDINDDMESYATNSAFGSDNEDDSSNVTSTSPLPPLLKKEPASPEPEIEIEPEVIISSPPPEPPKLVNFQKQLTPIFPNITISSQPNLKVTNTTSTTTATTGNPANPIIRTNAPGSIPFPLLILNGLPNQQNFQQNQQKKDGTGGISFTTFPQNNQNKLMEDVGGVLKELLVVEKEKLEVDKQRLNLDKQKLEFEKMIGTQFIAFLPVFGSILNCLADDKKENGKKRSEPDSGFEILRDSKILRNVLESGIKKYMKDENARMSETEQDSGIHQDDDSNGSSK